MRKRILIAMSMFGLVSGTVFCVVAAAAEVAGHGSAAAGSDTTAVEAAGKYDLITINDQKDDANLQVKETATSPESELPGIDLDKPIPEEPVPAPSRAQAANNEGTIGNKYIGSDSMVVSRDWIVDGVIAGEKDKKLMIAAGDTVYVNLGSDKVVPGTKCTVYRKIGRVKDPGESGENLGFEVRRVGKIEIGDDIGKNVSSARVIVSYEPIQINDAVKITSSEK
jgi:hypothetical protein